MWTFREEMPIRCLYNGMIAVHTSLNARKSPDGHAKNYITSPLLKSIAFYLV